jgi:hypothetical protein
MWQIGHFDIFIINFRIFINECIYYNEKIISYIFCLNIINIINIDEKWVDLYKYNPNYLINILSIINNKLNILLLTNLTKI